MNTKKNGVYKEIPVNQLFVDHNYQRQVSNSFVKRLVTNFDESLIGVLSAVVRKNGMFAVVDGQHRLVALKTLGYEYIPCLIYPEMTIKEEIEKFHHLNQNIHKLTALEDFWALVGSGDKERILVLETIEKHGLKVSKVSSNREEQKYAIGAIGIVMSIVNKYKIDTFNTTLEVITNVWPGNGEALSGQVLEGVAIFIKRHFDSYGFNIKHCLKTFKTIDASTLLIKARNQAKIYETRPSNIIADLLVETYNKRLSKDKKLSWNTDNN